MTEGRERLSRVDEVRQERRRRGDITGKALKLAIPADVEARLSAQGRTPRWINDVGSRVADLTVRDDWDVVEGVEPREVVIDRAKGETCKAILVSKPNAFIAEDAAKREVGRREKEAAMLKGQVPGNPDPVQAYVDPASRFERGNQIL